jgi:hypothetical protein
MDLKYKSYRTSEFDQTDSIGSFSSETLRIFVDYPYKDLEGDKPKLEIVLNHEFAHLFHFFTSYLGIKYFSYWAQVLDVFLNKEEENIPYEDIVTTQAKKIVEITRKKQILSIDDAYYYEYNRQLFDQAMIRWDDWTVSEIYGQLFDTEGIISDHYFWGSRFFIGPARENISFCRIPIGIRTILEHMANSIDFLNFVVKDRKQDLTDFFDKAKDPEFLHYNCLSHWISIELINKYNSNNNVYFIASELVSLLNEIPFDDKNTWETLITYAKAQVPYLVERMNFPHPSFLFPIIKKAAFKTNIDWEKLEPNSITDRANLILKEINLPSLKELKDNTYAISDKLFQLMDKHSMTRNISRLISGIQEVEKKSGYEIKLFYFSGLPSESFPIPIFFNDNKFIDGSIISYNLTKELMKATLRRDEMLRYHYTRNIISES